LIKRLERARVDVQRIKAEWDKAVEDVKRTTIRAPISGVITEDMVEAGAFVQRGTPLTKIEDTSKVEIHFDLQLDQLQWLWKYGSTGDSTATAKAIRSYELPKLPATVTLEVGDQDYVWNGRLARYNGAGVNAATRTVPCVAIVDNPTRLVSDTSDDSGALAPPPALLRGMFVSIQLKIKPRSPLLSIPEAAIRPGNRVWVLRDGKLVIEPVKVMLSTELESLVAAGGALQVGDKVIVSPLSIAANGMPLRQVITVEEEISISDEDSPVPVAKQGS
ncbi:MAG: HlyD family efflux transporter periplasmic adaptor subunit, partial [Planctomycetales bacterium]